MYGLPPPRIVIGARPSSAVRCRTLFVLSHCTVLLTPPAATRHRPVPHGRDQAPQRYRRLARQCHDHCRLARAARPLGPRAIPPRQRTVFTGTFRNAAPTGSAHVGLHTLPALASPFSSAFQTALVGRSREPGVARHRSWIPKLPRPDLPHQHIRRLDAGSVLGSRRTNACGPVSGARSSRSARVFSIELILLAGRASRAMSPQNSSMMFAGRPVALRCPQTC